MATTTLTHGFQKVTVSGTGENDIDFDNMLRYNKGSSAPAGSNASNRGIAMLELQSGSSVQFSPNAAIDSNSGTLTTSNPRAIVDIKRGQKLKFKGSAGSEVFTISIIPA